MIDGAMLRRVLQTAFGFFLFAGPVLAQGEWNGSVVARGLLTTSSKIYPNPDNPSFDLRTLTTPFTSVFGAGAEFRLQQYGDHWYIYLAVEYLSQIKSELKLNSIQNPPRRVPVDEGYRIIPIELGGQLFIPLGSQTWRLSMGGGIGAYHTERIFSIAGAASNSVGNMYAFGIHVSVNAEYAILPGIAVAVGVKFRDPEIDVRNEFASDSVVYNNEVIVLPKGEIPSRINVDGMTLSAGVRIEMF